MPDRVRADTDEVRTGGARTGGVRSDEVRTGESGRVEFDLGDDG